MGFAPELPSSETLQLLHPLSNEGRCNVHNKRQEMARALTFGRQLLVVIGPCAMTGNPEETLDENSQISRFGKENDVVVAHRLPPWKPRTNPEDWHGLETTDSVEAHKITVAVAEQSGNLAMEFGHEQHLGRYALQTALGWRGSRNDQQVHLLSAMADYDPMLPIAVKNGMDGSAETTLSLVEELSVGRPAPATLLFRGGALLDTKQKWVEAYKQVLDETKGNFIVDVAHGGEQSHDPNQKFGKSTLGQIACLGSILDVANMTGQMPRGIMIEASNIPSPTDPVIRLDEAFNLTASLADVHRSLVRDEALAAAD